MYISELVFRPAALYSYLLIGHGDDARARNIDPPERTRQRLDGDTRLHKVIETDIALPPHIVLCHNQLDNGFREVVTESLKGFLQLHGVNGSRAVEVVGLETLLPFLDVVPEADEFVEGDCPVVVSVEHVHHHTDRFDYWMREGKEVGLIWFVERDYFSHGFVSWHRGT